MAGMFLFLTGFYENSYLGSRNASQSLSVCMSLGSYENSTLRQSVCSYENSTLRQSVCLLVAFLQTPTSNGRMPLRPRNVFISEWFL